MCFLSNFPLSTPVSACFFAFLAQVDFPFFHPLSLSLLLIFLYFLSFSFVDQGILFPFLIKYQPGRA